MVQIRKEKTVFVTPSRRTLCIVFIGASIILLLIFNILHSTITTDNTAAVSVERHATNTKQMTSQKQTQPSVSYRTPLAYGTKSGKEQTAQLVQTAISSGFRHIVTGGHHSSHNESGVGEGWTQANEQDPSIRREHLFLQTYFVPWDGDDFKKEDTDADYLRDLRKASGGDVDVNENGDGKDGKDAKDGPMVVIPAPTIEEQVHISIRTSLRNLRTEYIDAVLFHNFRAKLYPYDQTLRAWRVLESYVAKGVVRRLGITSVHDPSYFQKLYDDTHTKPTIVQNRFHANRGYDLKMQPVFRTYDIQVQRFWLLNGSSGYGRANRELATNKKLTPAQLMLAFVMSFGSQTCLVGTHSVEHMKDDVAAMNCYDEWFGEEGGDTERTAYAKKLGMKLNDGVVLSREDGETREKMKRRCREYKAEVGKR